MPTFLEAIAAKRRLAVRFSSSRKEGRGSSRAPARRSTSGRSGAQLPPVDHDQLWIPSSGSASRSNPSRSSRADIVSMTVLEETFEPRDIITWAFKPGAWRVPRDWAELS